jgi:uncharacterized protein involved in exopolysaccharide biosynthesis
MTDPTITKTDPTVREQFDGVVRFLKRVARRYDVVIVMILIGVAACAVFLKLRVTPYKSETVMLYSEGVRAVDRNGEAQETPQTVAVRLREMATSRTLLEKVIDEFQLYPDVIREHGRVDAVEKFREKLEFRAPGGDTFSIGFIGNSPEQARAVTARLAELLVHQDSELRRDTAKTTREFLASEKQRTDQELKGAEKELAQFLAEHPEFALDSMLLLPGATSTGAAFRAEAEANRNAQAPAAAAAGGFRIVGGGSAPKPASIGGAAGIQPPAESADARAQLVAAQAAKARAEADVAAARSALAEKSARFTDQHPDVQAARANVQGAELRLRAAVAAVNAASPAPVQLAPIAASTPADGKAPARRIYVPAPGPKKDGEPTKARDAHKLISLDTEWTRLTGDVAEARERNKQIETAFFKADVVANSETGGHAVRISVIDPAYLPAKPMPPGRITWIAIFVGMALVIGIALAFGLAAIDDRIYGRRDALQLAPVLAEVPRIPRSAWRFSHG